MNTCDVAALQVEPHFPQVVHSDDHGRAIVLLLPAGEELQEHQTHEAAYLVVVDGQVEIVQPDGEVAAGGAGFFAHFAPGERREVRARDTSRLVLLLTPWPSEGRRT